MSTVIKAGTYCPVCRGMPLSDCRHKAEEFSSGPTNTVSRLRHIERGIRELDAELREQASGSQDGYLLGVADRLRRLAAL
jgi:hypothetical protein